MKKLKVDNYNDGVFYFGIHEESYDASGNALEEKEFIVQDKLFFSYSSIREQDRLKYDNTGTSLKMKLKVRFNTIINSNYVIKLNNEFYCIETMDRDVQGKNLYLYLTELKSNMDKHISIYKKTKKDILQDEEWTLFRTVWGDIKTITSVTNKEVIENGNLKNKLQKLFVIRYLEELDIDFNKKATTDYKIKYKAAYYNIAQINNVEEQDKLFEIKGDME